MDNGKAFVRPSGTEDVIRLYCEAETIEEMESMAESILNVINERFKGNFWESKNKYIEGDIDALL